MISWLNAVHKLPIKLLLLLFDEFFSKFPRKWNYSKKTKNYPLWGLTNIFYNGDVFFLSLSLSLPHSHTHITTLNTYTHTYTHTNEHIQNISKIYINIIGYIPPNNVWCVYACRYVIWPWFSFFNIVSSRAHLWDYFDPSHAKIDL